MQLKKKSNIFFNQYLSHTPSIFWFVIQSAFLQVNAQSIVYLVRLFTSDCTDYTKLFHKTVPENQFCSIHAFHFCLHKHTAVETTEIALILDLMVQPWVCGCLRRSTYYCGYIITQQPLTTKNPWQFLGSSPCECHTQNNH